MLRVLFDTNIISYWMWTPGEPCAPVAALLTELRGHDSVWYVSAVSIQELYVADQMQRNTATWEVWIEEQFEVLPFTHRCGREAARLQRSVGKPPKDRFPMKIEANSMWFRDAAIVGTACAEGLDVIVTADTGFGVYRRYCDAAIRILDLGSG